MTLKSADRKRLKAQAQQIDTTVQIGKGGLSATVIDEIQRQMKAQRLLKVKLLPSAQDEDALTPEALAQAVGAELVERRGHTIVLWRARAE